MQGVPRQRAPGGAGKLIEVAETWATGGRDALVDEGPIEALRAMNASADDIERARQALGLDKKREPLRLRVLAENWHAVGVFLAMETQWRIRTAPDGRARLDGLDYAALPIVLREHRRGPHRQELQVLMPQLREMERAAMRKLNP